MTKTAKVVSISLNDENVRTLDEIQATCGLSGRSEAIRYALRAAEGELKEDKDMTGPVEGVLVIVHRDHGDAWMSMIQHKYEDHIRTQMHSHLKDMKCLDVMIISSTGETMRRMLQEIHATGKADYVKFVRE
jgi:CopG family nickel-responsive transcriptional regulator